MQINKAIKYVAVFLFIIAMLSFSCFASYTQSIQDEALDILENISSAFQKPVKELKPVGIGINDGLLKNICIGFNIGLHNMSKIETLPKTFENPLSAEVPILLYHHITLEEGYGDNVMSLEMFEKHLDAIQENGYNTISVRQMIDFVYYGAPLPEKPILICFDDGYLSNYELAYPALKERNMKAIIFAIGWAIGKTTYKDTGNSIIPHFGFEEINEMTASGLIEVQSHTFDMHQSKLYESSENVRESALKLENESDADYAKAIEKDYNAFDTMLFNYTGFRNYALAYPHGEYSEISEQVLTRLGCHVSFSTEFTEKNVLVQGDLSTLRTLNRFTMAESIDESALIQIIDGVYGKE